MLVVHCTRESHLRVAIHSEDNIDLFVNTIKYLVLIKSVYYDSLPYHGGKATILSFIQRCTLSASGPGSVSLSSCQTMSKNEAKVEMLLKDRHVCSKEAGLHPITMKRHYSKEWKHQEKAFPSEQSTLI